MSEEGNLLAKLECNKLYKITEKIGAGANSEIFLLEENETVKNAAMKIYRLITEQKKSSFLREQSLVPTLLLGNPDIENYGIVCFKNSFVVEDSNEQFGAVVMEKMDGDLMDFILSNERISESDCKYLFKWICKSVQFCHTNHLFHCNLKPENILIKLNENQKIIGVKLAGFGSLTTKETFEPHTEFQRSSYLPFECQGNPYNRPIYSERIDVFSLGVILFMLLTGTYPFLIEKVVMKNDLRLVNRYCGNGECLDLLEKIFNEDPNQRPSVAEVLTHSWFSEPRVNVFKEVGKVLRKLSKH